MGSERFRIDETELALAQAALLTRSERLGSAAATLRFTLHLLTSAGGGINDELVTAALQGIAEEAGMIEKAVAEAIAAILPDIGELPAAAEGADGFRM